jgi:hypothetical protein
MTQHAVMAALVTAATTLAGPACAPGSYNPAWLMHEVRLLLTVQEIAALDALNTPEADALEAVIVDAPTPGDARRMTLATLSHWRKL